MLEKTGTILLTEDDLEQLKSGSVSERVRNTWNLTLQQLQEVVDNNEYSNITS